MAAILPSLFGEYWHIFGFSDEKTGREYWREIGQACYQMNPIQVAMCKGCTASMNGMPAAAHHSRNSTTAPIPGAG
jgi:hypothetical protein